MKRLQKPERIYVKVNSDFDTTGYVQPRSITWSDGRTFKIDKITDFRPCTAVGSAQSGDCYTIVINGEAKHLFFERTDPLFRSTLGRWFVESIK